MELFGPTNKEELSSETLAPDVDKLQLQFVEKKKSKCKKTSEEKKTAKSEFAVVSGFICSGYYIDLRSVCMFLFDKCNPKDKKNNQYYFIDGIKL